MTTPDDSPATRARRAGFAAALPRLGKAPLTGHARPRGGTGSPGKKPSQRALAGYFRARAYAAQRALGLAEEGQKEWNARQTQAAFQRRRNEETWHRDGPGAPVPHDERDSLTQATQADFPWIMAHFSALAGDEKAAAWWQRRAFSGLTQTAAANDTPEARRHALRLLEARCQEAGLAFPAYPLAITCSRKTWPDALEDCTPAQLMALAATMRHRRPTSEDSA